MTVYVVQNPHRLNRETQELEPMFDMAPAEEYGELVFLLSPNAKPFDAASVGEQLDEGLEDFSDNDYLLLVGNPALIGMACAIAARWNEGTVNVLQWNGRERRYIPIRCEGL